MVEPAGQRRFRLSIRTLMIAVALCALLLALAVWTFRQVEARVRLERLLAEARAQADRATYSPKCVPPRRAAAAKLGTADQKKAGSLWAGLSVNHPIFRAGQTKDLRIEFTLVNDGDQVIDPKIPESQIVINGKELSDSGLILSSVQKGIVSERCRLERAFNSIASRGPVQGARNLSDFLEGLVSTLQKSCSGSCPKEPADLPGLRAACQTITMMGTRRHHL